jgi:non-ribosomal peptide synthetase component E (peptide arylation enzyme)
MILTRAINAPRRDGLGEDVSLDALLRRHASISPDAPAVMDTADRPVFTDGKPRRMSWAALDVEVDRVAAGLKGLNLGRDAVVAVQMPNIVESAVAFLAVLRAGYIPSMLPLGWRRREIVQALTRTGAKAAITVGRAGPVAHAEIMAYAAAEVFTVRFLLA